MGLLYDIATVESNLLMIPWTITVKTHTPFPVDKLLRYSPDMPQEYYFNTLKEVDQYLIPHIAYRSYYY